MGSIANPIANLSHVGGMPDEPSWGQARRLLRENGIYDLRALVGTLKCEKSPKSLRSPRISAMFCHLLAGGEEAPVIRSYFMRHCMLPQLTSARYYGPRSGGGTNGLAITRLTIHSRLLSGRVLNALQKISQNMDFPGSGAAINCLG